MSNVNLPEALLDQLRAELTRSEHVVRNKHQSLDYERELRRRRKLAFFVYAIEELQAFIEQDEREEIPKDPPRDLRGRFQAVE